MTRVLIGSLLLSLVGITMLLLVRGAEAKTVRNAKVTATQYYSEARHETIAQVTVSNLTRFNPLVVQCGGFLREARDTAMPLEQVFMSPFVPANSVMTFEVVVAKYALESELEVQDVRCVDVPDGV